MWTIKQPSKIIVGENCTHDYKFPNKCLIVTSKGAKSRGWLDHLNQPNYIIYDQVESNPSMNTVEKILREFENEALDSVIGLGGGSVLDVTKFSAYKMGKPKILIPTTFGSGSEVTRISVLKVDAKKKSFHDDALFADVALVDPFFIKTTPDEIFKNSVIDACAQCTEAFDSKNSNPYTKFLCEKAFDFLEYGILKNERQKIVYGSLLSGLGFGNSSTTLGHALSYVYSNEGVSHGHALAFTTTIAHQYNKSIFYERFLNLVKKLKFKPIFLSQDLDEAAELILTDRKHLDNNPISATKEDIISLLNIINSTNFDNF